MAAPIDPRDNLPHSNSSASISDQISSSASDKKGKKKVLFVDDQEEPSRVVTPQETPDEPLRPRSGYFTEEEFDSDGTNATTAPLRRTRSIIRRPSFDEDEVKAAFTELLSPPPHQPGPSIPRAVRMKKMTPDGPDEAASALHRSAIEAKHRADRLAADVSRNGSVDTSDAESNTRHGRSFRAIGNVSAVSGTNAHAVAEASGEVRARKGTFDTARGLVRAHTHRKNAMTQPSTPPRPGTATPVEADENYVPRPEKFKGGVLFNLLNLTRDDKPEGTHRRNGSNLSVSSLPGQSPLSSPPTSRPGTPTSERVRPSLRGLRSHSASTVPGVSGLVGKSLMFGAPITPFNLSDTSEKMRRADKQKRSKQKEEEYRITVHIAQIICRHQYLIKLCNALMMYGAPTHRLETYMKMSSRVLGIEGQFMYLPGTMIISFDDSTTHTTEVKIVRTPQGVDLGRLRDVHEIYKEVVHDMIGVEEATERLEKVMGRNGKFPIWLRILLFGVASAFVAPFGFEGRYIDMPICFILGCLVGFLQLWVAPRNELYANVFEIGAAILTSFLSRVFGTIRHGKLFCFSALAQSSIALILPGYLVLCASLELQSHQMISGSVRMVYALIYSLFLGYGITIGSVIYGYMDKHAVSAVHCSVGETWYTQRPPPNFYILFVFPFTLCLCVINQSKWKQTPVMVFISLAGYCVNNFSSRAFKGNTTLSSFLGAFCIGVLANLYSRLGRLAKNRILDIWEDHIEPRIGHRWGGKQRTWRSYKMSDNISDESISKEVDPESAPMAPSLVKRARQVGFGLAAAAMLPAIFVQVPSGLAVGGSLLSGVASADQITRNQTLLANGTTLPGPAPTATPAEAADLSSTAFNVLLSVIQVAISISVGLSLSAVFVYPFGKRRSGLFSF
ncbi:pheromone-regulated membrane protein 10 [Podospora conica]|nr:pheromone-regulated membrane protein 10 [Schizothecium conicum]